MRTAQNHTMNMAEFLAWEERQEFKYEFDGFEPVAMVGVTRAHAVIERSILIALGNHLRGKPCEPYGSGLKIEVVGRIRYPDAFVVCCWHRQDRHRSGS
jgi:Uma2 family endonuclease